MAGIRHAAKELRAGGSRNQGNQPSAEVLVSKQQLPQACHQGPSKGAPNLGCLCVVLLALSWVISSFKELLTFAHS